MRTWSYSYNLAEYAVASSSMHTVHSYIEVFLRPSLPAATVEKIWHSPCSGYSPTASIGASITVSWTHSPVLGREPPRLLLLLLLLLLSPETFGRAPLLRYVSRFGSLQPMRREPPTTRSGLLKVSAHTARLGCSGGRVGRLFIHSSIQFNRAIRNCQLEDKQYPRENAIPDTKAMHHNWCIRPRRMKEYSMDKATCTLVHLVN